MRRWVLLAAWCAACVAHAQEIAVDVGHYKAEPGATSARGRAEFEFNLELAKRVVEALRDLGLRPRMIGERGDFAFLIPRVRAAEGAALMLSIHHDSIREKWLSYWEYEGATQHYNDDVAGFSLFVSRDNPYLKKALACASRIGEALQAAGFTPSRYHADPVLGENRPFADEKNGVHYYDRLTVAKAQTLPSVLFEAGVIINREEELRMRDPAVQERIARAVALGVRNCMPARKPAAGR